MTKRVARSPPAVTAEPNSLTRDMSDIATGKAAPDLVTRQKAVTRALRRLRAIARRKPIGTVEEFVAARRAAAAKE